jgi:hypothetical protein
MSIILNDVRFVPILDLSGSLFKMPLIIHVEI